MEQKPMHKLSWQLIKSRYKQMKFIECIKKVKSCKKTDTQLQLFSYRISSIVIKSSLLFLRFETAVPTEDRDLRSLHQDFLEIDFLVVSDREE